MKIILFAVMLFTGKDAYGLLLYVSPRGNDGWSGSYREGKGTDGPVATLEGARNRIRKIRAEKGWPADGVVVLVMPGVYMPSRPLVLTQQDSGTMEAPVVYQSLVKGEARINGAKPLRGFELVRDKNVLDRLPAVARGKVYQADLRALGIREAGVFLRRGFGDPINGSHAELIFDHKPMKVARWPNEGFLRITDVPEGEKGLAFGYMGENPTWWNGEKDIWAFGYWCWDWADNYVPIEGIDTASMVARIKAPAPKYCLRKNQRFYFLNVLAELDSPGEWYLDRDTGIIYFWPPDSLDDKEAEMTWLPELVHAKEASNVEFRGFVFENVQGTALIFEGGQNNRVSECTIRNTGNLAVRITGVRSGISDCEIFANGDGGIVLAGGDRNTLTPGGLFAVNNRIHDYSRWSRTVRPAVQIRGVGNRVVHNLIYDAPHQAIAFQGNDHRIEYNEIFKVLKETNDAGAIYTGRDWTSLGTVIRRNYLHDIDGFGKEVIGIYLDDQASGTTIEGNIFFRMRYAAYIGGGRDNRVENNIFVDCDPAVHLDARGLGWQKGGTNDPEGPFRKNLKAVPYDRPPYKTRYPGLGDVLKDVGTPKRNRIVGNISYRGRWDDIAATVRSLQTVERNWTEGDPGFLDVSRFAGSPTATDFSFRTFAPALSQGFQPIPVHRIGPVPDPSEDPP